MSLGMCPKCVWVIWPIQLLRRLSKIVRHFWMQNNAENLKCANFNCREWMWSPRCGVRCVCVWVFVVVTDRPGALVARGRQQCVWLPLFSLWCVQAHFISRAQKGSREFLWCADQSKHKHKVSVYIFHAAQCARRWHDGMACIMQNNNFFGISIEGEVTGDRSAATVTLSEK